MLSGDYSFGRVTSYTYLYSNFIPFVIKTSLPIMLVCHRRSHSHPLGPAGCLPAPTTMATVTMLPPAGCLIVFAVALAADVSYCGLPNPAISLNVF